MRFPAPSEAFSSVDINSMLQQGNIVNVYSMLPKHKLYKKLYNERHKDNSGLFLFHCNYINYLTSTFKFICNPFKLYMCIRWLVSAKLKINNLIKSFLLLPSAFNIYSSIVTEQPHIVHLYWGHYPSLVIFLLKIYDSNIKCTMFLGAYDLELALNFSISMTKHADYIFTHSNYNKKQLIRLGVTEDKIKVIYRGINIDTNVNPAIDDKKINTNNPTFLTGCRLIKEKGVNEVITIFNEILSTFPNSILYIAGDGPQKNNLLKMVTKLNIESNVIFLGHINQNLFFEYMCLSDFFILMTRYDGDRLPNVLKEAMYRKSICITTISKGISELIRHEKNGLILDKIEHVVKYLQTLKNANRVHLNEITDNAQLSIIKNFNTENTVRKYIQIWKSIICI
jgi:glycosyltransferase involved in cell wall biosynthesis